MTVISVRGTIAPGEYSWFYNFMGITHTTPEQFKAQLEAAQDDVIVEINSPGGFVNAAAEIYDAIRSFTGNIECRVIGQAASAASVIACAAKSSISPMGSMFLHNCIGGAKGNHNDMRQAAQAMESIDENIMEAYREKTGLEDAQIYRLMERNTTLSAKRAVELGFIDKITESAADLTGATSGIAASAPGFIDPMAIDAERLSAMRDLYEKMQLDTAEGGESSMEIEDIRDEADEAAETAEADEVQADEGDETAEDGDQGEAAEGDEAADEGETAEDGDQGEADEADEGDEAADEGDADDVQAAYDRGVLAERARIAGIMDIAATVPDDMVRAALFDEPISAEQLALSAMRAENATRTGYIGKAKADVAASGSANVAATVSDDAAQTDEDAQNAIIAKINERHGRN